MKGVFMSDHISKIAKFFDDLKKWNNPIVEAFDGKFYEFIIKLINDLAIDKLPDKIKQPLRDVVDLAFDKQWDELDDKVAEILVTFVDIRGLDEDQELAVAKTGIEFIVQAIKLWAEKKKDETHQE